MNEANIVKDFRIGNTRLKIADNYCKRTAYEVDQILKNIAEKAQHHFIASVENYKQEEN